MKAHLVLVILLVSSIYASSPCNRNSDPSCWVYGNHYDSTAYDFCAIGSVGCMRSSAEPIDVTQENDEVYNYLLSMNPEDINTVIIPGETPNDTPIPVRMSEEEHIRVQRAFEFWKNLTNGIIIVSGGNAHPRNPPTPYNEAYQMKTVLNTEYGVPNSRIVVEPYAQHSTTNLRNAGRFMLQMELKNATIVTGLGQSFYFGHGWVSSFDERCLRELGYLVGELKAITDSETVFEPSENCWTVG
eukprot:CAMPEP_0168555732 /NCGR_PEP_ID=MMETSP0413-20121227/8497_1 /TAXON_ID=136452 /ORGANISM="Filamoeba nolandi, Strain NC-AS-23-1" /LENGTH=242 /DNA_ID=CAMNT_0008586613 /DNA_START=19 /DNA_END=744 /DNA_ORIENTATION=+